MIKKVFLKFFQNEVYKFKIKRLYYLYKIKIKKGHMPLFNFKNYIFDNHIFFLN